MAVDSKKWSPDRALSALLDALDEGAIVFCEAHLCRAAGRAIGELLGVDPRSLVGLSRSEVLLRLSVAAAEPDAILSALDDAALSGESTTVDPIEFVRPHARIVVWTSVPIGTGAGARGRIDILRDVSRERGAERATEAMQRRLSEVSVVDELTGLANRRRFEQDSDREHRRAQRAWDSYAIARIDIDGMAKLNESLGRPACDELLRHVGEELRSARREYDLVARWEDDEFIVLLPGADPVSAKVVLKRAVAGMRAKGREIAPDFNASAGTAVWIPPSGETAADIIRRAGEALAVARSRGPGAVEIDAGFGEWKDEMTGDE
jgi:diguanylate cyclase (GGDEF)-like protein